MNIPDSFKGTKLIKELGIADSSFYLLDRFFRRVSGSTWGLYKYHVFSQPVPELPLLPSNRGKDIIVKEIRQGDPETSAFPRSAEVINSRYRQGGVCLSAYRKGEFAGYLWLNFSPYYEDEVRCCYHPLPEGKAAWDYDVYVDTSHRLSMVFPRLWDEANRLMRSRKVTFSMSRISAFNPGSLSSHRSLGAQKITALLFLCFGRFQIMFSAVRPFLHLSMTAEDIPHVRISSADNTT